MSDCIFCKMAAGEIRTKVIYQDERAVAFDDIDPKAPVHFLVIPRRHYVSLLDACEDEALVGHLVAVGARIAKERGIDGTGFRTVINTNGEAGQSVWHLHLHVLGGRKMTWPPG